ncbi:YciI family protein [Dactylosporangium darangshiense]|uniref:YCII-related domain-containing protein n=1 Tax=Dactylosporangium darangshiense TaxID=579108 RepID=A0ABP8D127_9ACTN
MWIVELSFSEDPGRLDARPAHRAILTGEHARGVVRMAGPLADESGAVIVLDLPDRRAVEEFIAADPYYARPGVTVERIRQWATFLP